MGGRKATNFLASSSYCKSSTSYDRVPSEIKAIFWPLRNTKIALQHTHRLQKGCVSPGERTGCNGKPEDAGRVPFRAKASSVSEITLTRERI